MQLQHLHRCGGAAVKPHLPTRLDKVLQSLGGLAKKATEAALGAERVAVSSPSPPPPTADDTACDLGTAPSAPAAWRTLTNPASLVFPGDMVAIDGCPMAQGAAPEVAARVFALDKPRGMPVELGRGKLEAWLARLGAEGTNAAAAGPRRPLMYVGRLDKATTGLLLVTDDGDLCSLVCEPGRCTKIYEASIACRDADGPTAEQLAAATAGIELADGPARALECSLLSRHSRVFRPRDDPAAAAHTSHEAVVRVVMNTGRYRIVRRLLAAAGMPVQRLRRTTVGPVSFEALAAAGTPLDGAGKTSVAVPDRLVAELWRSVGGRGAAHARRLAALRAQAAAGPVGGEQADLEQHDRLQQWLQEHDMPTGCGTGSS